MAACQASGAPTGATGAARSGSPTTGSATDSSRDRALGTGLGATTIPGAAGNPGARTVRLTEQSNSGITGQATLTDAGSQTMLQVTLSGTADAHPAHIHNGTCANLDPTPLYPLATIQGGMSSTTVPAAIADLTSGQKAINVHRSQSDMQTYVACGDIR